MTGGETGSALGGAGEALGGKGVGVVFGEAGSAEGGAGALLAVGHGLGTGQTSAITNQIVSHCALSANIGTESVGAGQAVADRRHAGRTPALIHHIPLRAPPARTAIITLHAKPDIVEAQGAPAQRIGKVARVAHRAVGLVQTLQAVVDGGQAGRAVVQQGVGVGNGRVGRDYVVADRAGGAESVVEAEGALQNQSGATSAQSGEYVVVAHAS